MIIVDYGTKPTHTIFYLAGEILKEIILAPCTENNLIEKIFVANSKEFQYQRFELALYVLLLTNKLDYYEEDGELTYAYKQLTH